MKELFQYIPPPSSDYSGIISILFQLKDCLNILVTPKGCIKTILEIDILDEFKNDNLFYTSLTQNDVISGFDEDLIYSIESIFKKYPKKYINIINTPVPTIIGSNLNGIGKVLEKKLKVPVTVFNSTGFENYSLGISEALLRIGKRFISFNYKKILNSVNIIGYSPLIVGNISTLNSIRKLIENCGVEVISIWCNETNIEKLKEASCASLNIVISAEGIQLAEYMKNKFNIPYILDMPIGISRTNKFLGILESKLKLKPNKLIYKKNYLDKKVLIIGTPLESLYIKYCLNEDFGIKEIKIVSLISSSRKEKRLYDQDVFSDINFVYSEYELLEYIKNLDISVLIADPLYHSFVDNKVTFIPHTNVALSGKEFINVEDNYIAEKGFEYFYKYLMIN
ncbi:nitrogenase component 1 [Clostridium cochlearium]|uniref:Nitrogenase molybdenum-iron protein, alpha and beta chains n=1 Tax=Clostridium cochlearium TaxID=1494 RepID=A0ABY0QLW3_CLOCO|nr:nitrogenase component 1 [Clostridium cochlearium]SDL20645.1 Nitrogenase molybdenum-iron protein, alpha and beta chains [Clostridium cochlearium]SNV76989.1 oxidoreductase/nitrogenase component 1 [Clostridium cochlearium]STA92621.1 oxidoreductase/nitrogenase component 1 [Clostridium cochlearium]